MNWYLFSIILLALLNVYQMRKYEKVVKRFVNTNNDLSTMQRAYLNQCTLRKKTVWGAWSYLRRIQYGSFYNEFKEEYLFEQWWESIGKSI